MEVATNTKQKYDSYKASGVEWIGEIPEHWKAIRMKFLYKDYSEKNRPNEELLSVTQNSGVIPRSWVENRMVMPSGNLSSFKFIKEGDFAISLRSFEGGLEYCYHDGIISPAYTVLKKRKSNLEAEYYKYLFKSHSFISELQTSVVGIRQGKNISFEELSYSIMPIPPLQEQKAIARFLDQKTSQLDSAVAQKEALIHLLKERKQILIQNAVTKGLDPNVKLKDSGVEWIGEIPEHWEVKRLKFLTRLISEKVVSKESKLEYVGMENIESWSGKFIPSNSETEGLANYFEEGDILFGKLRPYLAKVYVAEKEGICTTEFLVYRVKKMINNSYLFILLLSFEFINLIDSSTYGSKMPRANSDFIGNQMIPIPPLSEQQAIAKYIETESQKIDKALALQQVQIEKLKEYKQSLIDAAVTGKVKVINK
ncbi:restriction endonuclease subunit S [Zunongwangia atlantica]|uniref:Type I restriction-modification system n=1 Tax=Zunongwangia atlantica 22II14-10F7 TaxID=1185767 RepID=A0A1Y1SY23_9FLAO|nr:restriction endonuclease subunit S [Zunongwangia atlantica]ORL43671.1 type I restriction-modification system [Zunongwangia atlantica 22II14-10F7]